jgi:hypothetical protein
MKEAQFRSLELLRLFWHPLQLREAARRNMSLTIDRTSISLRLVFDVVLSTPSEHYHDIQSASISGSL